jgi:hypothetical protein
VHSSEIDEKFPTFPPSALCAEQCTNYGYLFKLSHGTLKRICHPTDFSGAFPPEREVTSAPQRIDIHAALNIVICLDPIAHLCAVFSSFVERQQ